MYKKISALRQIASNCEGLARNCLTRVKRIFPKDTPQGGIAALIRFFTETLQLDRSTNTGGKPFSSFQPAHVLRLYVKVRALLLFWLNELKPCICSLLFLP